MRRNNSSAYIFFNNNAVRHASPRVTVRTHTAAYGSVRRTCSDSLPPRVCRLAASVMLPLPPCCPGSAALAVPPAAPAAHRSGRVYDLAPVKVAALKSVDKSFRRGDIRCHRNVMNITKPEKIHLIRLGRLWSKWITEKEE